MSSKLPNWLREELAGVFLCMCMWVHASEHWCGLLTWVLALGLFHHPSHPGAHRKTIPGHQGGLWK